jgi:hypothetical protein
MAIFGIIFLIIGAIIGLGWIALLIIGIVLIKKKKKTAGIVLTVVAGVWGLIALLMIGGGIYGYRRASKMYAIEDFNPAEYKGEMGSIVVPHKGKSSLAVSDKKKGGRIQLSTKDGVFSIPTGAYTLSSYDIIANDKNNIKWEASGSLYSIKSRKISIEPDSRKEIQIGPPFIAKIEAKKKGQNEATFDFKLIGSGGGKYTIGRYGKGKKAPRFQVIDKSGNILWQDKFEYG